jgi:holo-[acyl-carrier protein] synthase
MTILGLGVDLVHLPRIATLLARRDADKFARRILSEAETLQWKVLVNDATKRAQFLAVRYVLTISLTDNDKI